MAACKTWKSRRISYSWHWAWEDHKQNIFFYGFRYKEFTATFSIATINNHKDYYSFLLCNRIWIFKSNFNNINLELTKSICTNCLEYSIMCVFTNLSLIMTGNNLILSFCSGAWFTKTVTSLEIPILNIYIIPKKNQLALITNTLIFQVYLYR